MLMMTMTTITTYEIHQGKVHHICRQLVEGISLVPDGYDHRDNGQSAQYTRVKSIEQRDIH